MARKSIVLRQQRGQARYKKELAEGKKPTMPTRVYNRCSLCDRRHGFMRFFGVCRICFRELAVKGEIPGIRKSSW